MPRSKAPENYKTVQRVDPHPIDHHGITPYYRQFLEWSAVSGLSAHTVKGRERSLTYFIRWCDDRSLDTPQEITRPILERYKKYLHYYRKQDGNPLSISSQCQRIDSVRAFFKWLTRENHILYNPASELESPKQHKTLPRHILSLEEIERVAHQAILQDGASGIRNRAIIETLYSTGLRRMEMVNLKLYDLDLNSGTLMVRAGKGGKDRMVPVGERACAWLNKYLEDARPQLEIGRDNGDLFLTDYGQPFIKDRMGDLVKSLLLAAGIDKPGACHLFRHAMATHMLENGADIRFIQAMLGHSKLETTEIYTRVSIGKLKEIHNATHPARLTRQHDEADGSC